MTACPNCGEQVPDGLHFCDLCGAHLPESAPPPPSRLLMLGASLGLASPPSPAASELPEPDRFVPFASRAALRKR